MISWVGRIPKWVWDTLPLSYMYALISRQSTTLLRPDQNFLNLRPPCSCLRAVQLLTPKATHRKEAMMTALFGREYSRRELLGRVGDMSQLAGTRKAELVEIRKMNF